MLRGLSIVFCAALAATMAIAQTPESSVPIAAPVKPATPISDRAKWKAIAEKFEGKWRRGDLAPWEKPPETGACHWAQIKLRVTGDAATPVFEMQVKDGAARASKRGPVRASAENAAEIVGYRGGIFETDGRTLRSDQGDCIFWRH